MLRWREIGGRPGEGLYDRLHHRIERYQVEQPAIRIGLTTDPMRRWTACRSEGWKEMVMIYSTSNQAFAIAVGEGLAARGWKERFTVWNYEPEGERIPGDYLRYYLYVLVPNDGPAQK